MEISKIPDSRSQTSAVTYLLNKSDHEFTVNKDIKKAAQLRYQAANLSQRYGNQKWHNSILHDTAFMLESAGLEKLRKKDNLGCVDWFGSIELFKEALEILPLIENPNKIFRMEKILEVSFNRVYKPLRMADESGDNESVIDYLCDLSSLLDKSKAACPSSEKLREFDNDFEEILEDYPYSRIEIQTRAKQKEDHKSRLSIENRIFADLDSLRRHSESKEFEFESVFRHNMPAAIKHAQALEKEKDHENASYLYSALSKLFREFASPDSAELAEMRSITHAKEQRRQMECENKLPEALFWCQRAMNKSARINDINSAFLMKAHSDILKEEVYKSYGLS